MNTKLLFVIGFLALSALSVNGADSDYVFQDDLDRCVNTADDLCVGSSENAGDCALYQGLVNISAIVQVNLTTTQRTTLTTFIQQVKTTVLASTTFTNEQKFIKFSALLSKFSEENSAIYSVIQYKNITTWSSINTVQKVTITKQQTLIQSTITLNNNDDCPLFDSLIAAAQSTGDQNIINAVNAMIQDQLIDIASDSSISFEQKTIQIQAAISQLFVTYSSFKSVVSYTEISGFGTFSQFFGCSKTYTQVEQAPGLCTGTFPNIPVITYLQSTLALYKTQNVKIALQFNQFIARVNQSFQQITDVQTRELWLADYVQQWMVLNYQFCTSYIFSVSFGSFGSLYDFCICPGFPGPTIVTIPTVPTSATVTTVEGFSSSVEPSAASSWYTDLPSSSSSCGCVCE